MTPRTKIHADYSPAFEALWKAYPRRVGKLAAYRAYCNAVRVVDPDELFAAVVAFASSAAGRKGPYCPHLSTWLNAGRWEDDRSDWGIVDPKQAAKEAAAERKLDAEGWFKRFQVLPVEERAAVRNEANRLYPNTTNIDSAIVAVMRKRGGA